MANDAQRPEPEFPTPDAEPTPPARDPQTGEKIKDDRAEEFPAPGDPG